VEAAEVCPRQEAAVAEVVVVVEVW